MHTQTKPLPLTLTTVTVQIPTPTTTATTITEAYNRNHAQPRDLREEKSNYKESI